MATELARWLAVLESTAVDLEVRAELRDELTRFASLLDEPRELVRDALAPIATVMGRHRQRRLLQDVLTTFAARTPYADARAWALVNVADSKCAEDDFEGALPLLTEAREIFGELIDDEGLAKALIHIADIGRFSDPLRHMEFDVAIVHSRVSQVAVDENPLELYERAAKLSRNPVRQQRALLSAADLYLSALQPLKAVETCRKAALLPGAHHDVLQRRWAISAFLGLATGLRSHGQHEFAREIALHCQQMCNSFGIDDSWREQFGRAIDDLIGGDQVPAEGGTG